MSISRKFQRSKSKYTLSQKIISAVTAAGFIMQPIVGFAGQIIKQNDLNNNLIKNGVADIWADKVVDKTAINVFNKFNLSANEIANMYFGLKGTEHNSANLVNFVNDRIDINGTVNAVQNSQIGGNLFFLSKEGMAVGKSGVINTGSLYVMTPTPDFMEAVQTVGTEAPAEDANKYLGYITNITDPTKANAWEIIPVNTSGTITVLGKVNATNEVQMRAAKIGVGKNVDDQVVDEVASGDTVSAASITTGVTNFGDLVNIKGVDGAEDVKSGLTGELTATQTGSGDIVLSAYVDGATEKNDLEELPFIGGTFGPIAETAENTFVEQDFNASVDVYGYVETTGEEGHININATAVNSNVDVKDGNYVDNKNTDVAQLANVKAEVNIGGTVNAAEDVTVKAEAINRYIDNSGAVAKAVSVGVSSGTPITGDVAYSVLNTEANVNITSDGSIKSGKGVDIDAKAETLAASAASVTALKFKAAGGTTGANVPAVSVLYTNAVNKANVTVEGNINAAEGNINAAENISIDADADMKVDAENKMGIKGKMGNQFVVGVTVAGAENSASVDIKDEDNSNNVINAGNDLSVNANATSDFTSGTSIKAPEASAMAVAVNVTDFNSNANVNIDTDLTAGNDLTVKADNIITDDNVIAESTIGSGKYVSAATQVVTGHVEQKKGEVKEFISGLAAVLGKGKKLPIGDEDEIPGLQLSEIFKAGATVTYSGQKHDSSVTIGKNASLKANEGKLDIGALTKIEDAHITATGTTSSYNDAYPAELTVNAAVLVNNMDNSSSVVVADRDAESTEPTLSGKNGVSVNASTRFEYNRIKNMIQDVNDAANQIASAVRGLKGSIKNDFKGFIDTLNEQIDAWESAFSTADETLATSDKGVLAIGEAATAGYNVLTALNNLNTMLDNSGSEVAADTKAAIQGASDLLTSALAFADPNSYGNFAASSASKGSSGDTGSIAGHHSSAVNGAGTVMVNTVNSVSKVEIGSNAVINAVGKVELNAENYMKDVSLGGLNAVPITNSGGGTAASIGATVNYSDFNTDTIVAVNDGANISGGDINIAGSNEIDHVSVAGSAGMGPSDETESKGIVLNGMLSFVDGSSDILTVVDDGAELTANAQKQYTETVKDEETGEETEVTKTSEGNISISGHNDTNIVNVAAGLNLGSGSSAVGVGLAYNDFAVKNIAGVADVAEQIKNLYSYKDDNGEVAVDDSKVAELVGELNNTYTASSDTNTKGSISAYGFDVDAATEGSIQSVSVAASASKNDDTGEVSFFGKIKGGISNVENALLGNGGKLDQVTGKIFGTESGKANEMFNKGSSSHGTGGGIELVGSTSGKGGFMPSFSIAGSGSVSLNSLNNATEAVVDNAKISMKDKGDISVTARDALYAGAYSGAAALQWKSGGSSSDKAVGFAGAAGVNDIDNVVKAVVKNSTIENAGEFNTMALSGGEQLALGLGLAVEKTGSTSGYSGNAAVSVNLIDHEVEALHENNKVTNTDDVNVTAYARDIENAGGGGLTLGQQKVGVGATVGVAELHNNISAGIKGGEYKDVGNVDVEALNALQNITVGIAAGLTLPSSGSGASAVVEGAGVYNEVHNTTKASIEGSDNKGVEISTISTADAETGNVNVIAQDVAIDKNSLYEALFEDIDMSDVGNELGSGETVSLIKDSGSNIITVAGGLAATTGKGAGGAAVAITDIENTYTADVKYADITADELDVDAGSNSNIVTVAGGIAAANKGSGVGSVSWNDVINTANVNIANSHIYAQQTTATAANQAQIVSVGGQISGAGKAVVGATLSYVGLDNTTKVNISTTEFDERTANEGTSVTAKANNTSDSYNIGAGVSAAGTAAVSGTVVVTQTKGTAGAVMDGAKINNAKEIIAHASDDTDILSVIGTVNIAGKAAVGAGVAYTEIGGVSDDKEKAEQHVTAEIKNSTINTAAEGTKIEVKAEDNSKVTNIAVGVGGALRAAVQGASATTLINKATTAGINNTQIDAPVTDEEGNSTIEGSTKANVTVDAQNSSEITSSADTASVAGQGVAAGAGIAVNRIIQQTNADVNGGVMNVNNLKVNANGTPRIENVGIGIAVAAQGAGATGSVAVNMIQNDVTAHIGSGANIVADGSVGVVATSDEQIANYAGQAAVAGQGAGVGVSVAVNQIAGTTSATVGGKDEAKTSVTAKGKSSLNTNTFIRGYEYGYENKDETKNSQINNALISQDTVSMNTTINRESENRSGLVVDASSTRDMKSFLLTVGVGGMGAGVTGTVNVNMIKGATNAGVANTIVDGTVGGANAPDKVGVFVNAGDYTNMSGFVGSGGVGGIGAGVGLGSDTNTFSRNVEAVVENSDIKANTFEVDADSQQGISSFAVGAGIAGVGGGVAGIVTVTELENATKAALLNSNVNANTVNINANHTGVVNAGNVSAGVGGVGAGVGISVGVLKDNSSTEVTVGDDENAKTQGSTNITAANDVNIAAENTAVVKPMISATGGAGVGAAVAGATSVNNLNSVVKTNVNNAVITSNNGNINGTANNTFNVEAYSGGNAIGGAGIGVGANVTVNTIDSTVQTNVNDSTLNAKVGNVILTADEDRNIEQLATNIAAGGIAAGANIAITSVGEAIGNEDSEKISNKSDNYKEANDAAADKIAEANNAYGANDTETLLGDSAGALGTAGIDDIKLSVDAGYGGLEDENGNKISQITVNITNSNIDAGNNVTANATENDNINMTLGSGAAGAAAVNAGVGILNVYRNVGVNITGAEITAAKAVELASVINGSSNLDVYQGTAGILGVNAAYGGATSDGTSGVTISSGTIDGGSINILAEDAGRTDVDAIGITAGVVSAGAIVAEGTNESQTAVNISDTEMNSDADIDIKAERQAKDSEGNTTDAKGNKYASLNINATAGSGGLLGAGAGLGAVAEEKGSVKVNLSGMRNTLTAGEALNINAFNAPVVNVSATSGAGSLIAAASVTYAEANIDMDTEVNVDGYNTLAAGSDKDKNEGINISAEADAAQNVEMEAIGVAIGGAGQANAAEVNITSDVKVDIAGNTAFKANVEKENVDVNIKADNTATQSANAYGLAVGAFFATGTNLAEVNTALKTNVNVGSSDASKIKDMDVEAHSKADTAINSDGSGGGMLDMSPIAAQAANNVDSETKVNITGTWNVAGDMKVEAVHENDIDIIADAVKASVAGYSGVESKNEIKNDTGVTFTGAKVTTGGDQDITARNNIVYNADVTGSGYGGVQGADVYAKDVMELKADVSLDEKTELKAGGLVDINALTTDFTDAGDENSVNGVDKAVTIKSAGLIAGTYAYSDNDIKFTNTIDVDTGSSITTVGTDTDNADITLTAADRTDFTDIVTADTQGGVIGAAGTKLENDIIRTNAITVGGMVDSNYDANFDAGDSSVMNLTLRSNAYNKTAAPLVTDPYISGTMKQYSSIDFEAGSSVKSLRNINAAAGAGDTTIAKESKTWRWVDGGETGTGSIASTSDGTLSGDDAKINTTVTVDGTLEAGKNHELEITINSTDDQKAALDQAIKDYGTALENDDELGFKIFIDNLDEAQEDYNNYIKDTTNDDGKNLDELTKERDQLQAECDANNTIYKGLQEGVNKISTQLDTAKSEKVKAESAKINAEKEKADWFDPLFQKYKDDGGVLTESLFESRVEDGVYGEENQKILSEYNKKIEELTKTFESAADKVENLENVLNNKTAELSNYDNTDNLAQIGALNEDINYILAQQEYKVVLDNLKEAQNAYNEALEKGVSAESVNGVIFKKGQEDNYLSVSYGEGSEWYKQYYGSPLENVGMADYAAGLLTRYNEIVDMMQNYTGTDISQVYSAELSRIQSELQTLGIGYTDKATGTFVVATGVSTVPTIELKDLMVSGGNVNISAGTLTSEKGSGSITAHGKPIVSITNNTDFFLHVNDVTVESDGGKVTFNNASVNTTKEQPKYNGITVTAEQPNDINSNNAQITIQNTTEIAAADSNIYTPDIGIYGTISNPFGNVTINNENNSIYVAGEVKAEDGKITQEAGSIKGRTINLEAGGAITQGYSDEIRNAGGSPEDAIDDDLLAAIQEALINNENIEDKSANGKYYTAFEDKDDLIAFLMTIEVDGEPLTEAKAKAAANALTGQIENSTDSGIKAGGAIYINAASINVNGIIQSGFESYKLLIDDTKTIDGLTLQQLFEKNYNKNTATGTSDYSQYMTDTYLVTKGISGAVYENDKFVYNIKAWYNPETNEIFTEDIDQAGGGRIYLTGAIANTNSGGGKLVVLDGGANYYINGTVGDETTNNFTFKLGSINADTVAGRIEINDTNTGNKVVYSRIIDEDGELKTVITTTGTDNNDAIIEKDANASITYDPIDGLYYNWSNGTSSRVVTTYQHVTDSSWFGLDKNEWQSELSQSEKDSMRLDQQTFDGLMTDKNGEIIAGSVINNGTISTDYDYIEVDGKVGEKTEVVSSGKTGNNNLYQISFQRKGKPKQAVDGNNKPLYWTMDENGTKVTTTEAMTNGVANEPIYATDSKGNIIYETEVSEMTTTTKKKGLFGLWGKTVTTEWKETSGMITAYNFGLKADNSIGIEFVGNKTSTGTITSNSDILLGGDIYMGQVEITSTGGSINHVDNATVISDNASFKAYDDIDVIQKNVNNALHLNAESAGGDINIKAIASNANNMVYIDKVSTGKGNVNAETNNVTITAEGDLLNGTRQEGQVAVVSGDGITLQSYGGSIGSDNEENGGRLLIDGDVHYGVEGDTTHNAINANAAGSVYLTEVDGNMYLGEIVAEGLDKNGNVVLEVKGEDAGFVDAIVNNSNDNKDDNRIAEWEKLGLLGDDTKDNTQNNQSNQLTNLKNAAESGSMFYADGVTMDKAQEQGNDLLLAGIEFVNLMKGDNAEVQAAREDLNVKQGALNEAVADLNSKKDGSEEAYKDALKKYNDAYDYYAKVGADYEQKKATFIENSVFADNEQAVSWLLSYEAIGNAQADNYGWTQQQLLYAVQDTVINPNAGSVSDVKTANVTGNNITFISNTGNLGVVDKQTTTIGVDELADLFTRDITKNPLTEKEQEQLDKLASARAGDVVWGDTAITIERTTPVSIKLNKNSDGKTTGMVTVQSKDGVTTDHIYLLAKDSVLNADKFAANDLRLSGQEGLNVNEVIGNSIYLEGGSGDIGHKVNDALQAVQVTLTNNGYVSANAAGNIKLQQILENPDEIVDFTLGSVAGTNVDITANGNIVSKADDIGYINASDTINLVSTGGGIGTTTKGLRIKNSGAVVNTNVQNAINIEAKQDGTLILGEMYQTKGGVNVDSEGSIMLGRENDAATTEDESVTGSIDAKDDVTLHAEDDIIISGKLHVNATYNDTASDNGTLQLHSNTGDIIQTTAEKGNNIVAANVGIAAVGGDVKLDNQYNIIKNVDLQAVGGSLGLTVSNPYGFNVDMGGFTNKQGGDISLTNNSGSVNITTQDITDPKKQDEANINGSLTVTADRGDKATEADINNEGILNATENITFNAADDVNNNGIIKAGANVGFEAGGNIENNAAVDAGKDVTFNAADNVNNNSTINAGANVSFGAGNDVNNEGALVAGRDVSFGAGNDIINKDIVDAGRNVNFNAAENIYNNSTVNADETIEFTAVGGVINSDTVNGKDVIMQAIEQELENILAKDSVTLNGDRIHGQNITQNTEADGDLIINTDSNSGSGPIESLVIDKIDANDKSVFTELWAVEADITTVDDKMDFNDIMIEENAWLENSGTLATIYGNVPVKDDDANVHIYQSYPSMYVNFIDADTVETDGRLLSLDDYWYAYDQRFTAENHLRWQHGRYLDEDWKQAYGYGLSLHNRYGLIDYQEFTETNAGADEVAVEA